MGQNLCFDRQYPLIVALHNPDVTWEKSFKQDYGVDLNILNNRLKATFDYYIEHRKDILVSSDVCSNISFSYRNR